MEGPTQPCTRKCREAGRLASVPRPLPSLHCHLKTSRANSDRAAATPVHPPPGPRGDGVETPSVPCPSPSQIRVTTPIHPPLHRGQDTTVSRLVLEMASKSAVV